MSDAPVRPAPTLDAIMAPVAEDLRRVEHALRDGVRSLAPQIGEIGEHVFSGGGKRIRPALVLLSAQMCGYRGPRGIQIAAAAEHLHTATLIHDDVVDGADLRRGNKSVNARFGPRLSVLVGDFLYAVCCQMLVEDGSPDILAIFAESIRSMAEGEVLQLSSSFDPAITESRYFEVIDRKTSMLIASCTEAGAVLGNVTRSERRALREIGREMGLAFQLVDDALDYPEADSAMGKPPLADASEGKITLPLILTLKRCAGAERDEIGAILKARVADRDGADPNGLAWIADCVRRHRGVEQTLARADALARKARQRIEPFADSEAKQSLIDLTEFIVRRRS